METKSWHSLSSLVPAACKSPAPGIMPRQLKTHLTMQPPIMQLAKTTMWKPSFTHCASQLLPPNIGLPPTKTCYREKHTNSQCPYRESQPWPIMLTERTVLFMKGSFVSTNFQYFYLFISKIRIFARHYFTFFIKDIPYWRIKCPAQNSKNKTGISTPYTANLIYLKKKIPGTWLYRYGCICPRLPKFTV